MHDLLPFWAKSNVALPAVCRSADVRNFTRLLVWLLLPSLIGTAPSFAATLDTRVVCGTPNEEVSQETKGNLEGKAQTFARLGTAELTGAVSNAKREIEIRENRSDAARELHYINYISCVLIYQDDHLSTDDKLKGISVLGHALNPNRSENSSGGSRERTNDLPADLPAIFPETDATRVRAFKLQTPPQEVKPGFRKWTRVAPDVWEQLYPDGTKEFAYKVKRINLYDCDGTVVSSKVDQDFQVFFPDKNCQTKEFMFQGNLWHSYVPIDHME